MEIDVSVVMPAFNSEEYIEAAVKSVLTQSLTSIELIVVDDCSTDQTYFILEKLAKLDNRIRLYKNKQNLGVAKTRNFGISLAKGKAIALLDSDDIWETEKLSLQFQLFKQGNKIVYCSYDFINDEGQTTKKPFIVPESTNYTKMLTSNVISCSTILSDAKLLKDNPFSDQYYHEDYVLWMQLIKIVKHAVGLSTILAHYRLHENSRSSKKANAALQRWKIYREELGLSFLKTTYVFAIYAIKGIIKYYIH
ncbi:MAG: glycosyltransferase family 2 protein [Lachnospiraceae bacterium]|nr:glycosyltransferase family 2 protein [Lachnospiraceae bacterium]